MGILGLFTVFLDDRLCVDESDDEAVLALAEAAEERSLASVVDAEDSDSQFPWSASSESSSPHTATFAGSTGS